MMKYARKIIALLLTIIIMITILPVSASATEENTSKEEVVYINLNADGSVKEINVVNIFDMDKSGKITDYGQYESLRNMTTTDEINYQNNTVTIDAEAGKLYYEGKLKDNVMPWRISVKYYIDGKEYTADKIAGMNGKLEIKISVRQNKSCDSSFFEGYALQISLVLDTQKAADIKTEGATIANVGSNKQLTYTILPNSEKDINISADVTDFEMEGIAINGVRMNMEFDIENDEIQEKISQIVSAVNDLDDGAEKINNGASDLYDATGDLKTAAGDIYTGVGTLCDGSAKLEDGLSALTSKKSELTDAAMSAFVALCNAAQIQLNSQLSENGIDTVTLTPSTYADVLLNVLAKMDADTVYNEAYNAALAEVTAQVETQADTLYLGYIQSQADTIYMTYIESQADSLYEQAATEAVFQQLVENGYSEEQAATYLQTDEGKVLVTNAVANMTDEQKNQIIAVACSSLTDEQKEQILQGALNSLTKKQKSEIRNTYIKQMMATDEVTAKINNAVKSVNSAAAEVSSLKGQLDNYDAFYDGLIDYTDAVDDAADGAKNLKDGLSTLYENTETFKNAVGDIDIAVGDLKNGTTELKEGTGKFVDKTSDLNTQVDDEINSMTSTITGKDVETVSFVSKRNTNIESVQFVIQTDSIEKEKIDEVVYVEEEKLNP
ncbi:MAG: hypothetical protein ACI4EF_09480, partial [Coprococcus sp.]